MPPLVIAHRGASAYEAENTLRAFALAIEQGAQMIELDLHATRDGRVVVIHDATLDHTTNLKGRVDQLDLKEIKRADAGRGERVPTLEETLDLTLRRVRLYLEIKDANAAMETLRIIRARRCQAEVLLASFDLELMWRLGEEVRDMELGVILGDRTLKPRARWQQAAPWRALSHIRHHVVAIEARLCFGYLVRRTQATGKRVYAWTVDEERQFAKLIARGVDGIVTNRPDRLVAYLNRATSSLMASRI